MLLVSRWPLGCERASDCGPWIKQPISERIRLPIYYIFLTVRSNQSIQPWIDLTNKCGVSVQKLQSLCHRLLECLLLQNMFIGKSIKTLSACNQTTVFAWACPSAVNRTITKCSVLQLLWADIALQEWIWPTFTTILTVVIENAIQTTVCLFHNAFTVVDNKAEDIQKVLKVFSRDLLTLKGT